MRRKFGLSVSAALATGKTQARLSRRIGMLFMV
jgi:hypothetical protein